jgi:hypothetical protein
MKMAEQELLADDPGRKSRTIRGLGRAIEHDRTPRPDTSPV